MCLLSIIIPIYNTKEYLERCIGSVLNQMTQEVELILVDDGSTDGSGELCDRYASSAVRVIHQSNMGESEARNRGIREAAGEYVQFLDSDDYIVADALQRITRAIQQRRDVILLNYRVVDAHGIIEQQAECADYDMYLVENGCQAFYEEMLRKKRYHIQPWRSVVKRELLANHDIWFIGGITNEDSEWSPKIHVLMQHAAVLEEPLVMYQMQRQGNISSVKDFGKLSRDFEVITKRLVDFLNAGSFEADKELFLKRNIAKNMMYALCYAQLEGNGCLKNMIRVLANEFDVKEYRTYFRKRYLYCTKLFGLETGTRIFNGLFEM